METLVTSNKSRQLHLNGIKHHLLPTFPELVLRTCPIYFYILNHVVQLIHSQKARQVCQTGFWRWNVEGHIASVWKYALVPSHRRLNSGNTSVWRSVPSQCSRFDSSSASCGSLYIHAPGFWKCMTQDTIQNTKETPSAHQTLFSKLCSSS